MSAGKIAAVVVGALMGLVGLGFLLGGSGLLWANESQRAEDGYFTSEDVDLTTGSFALTSAHLDFGAQPGDWFPSGRLATVRLDVTGSGEESVFVGIGPEEQVEAYLNDVAHTEVTRIRDGEASYRDFAGTEAPLPPGEQDFWEVSVAGAGDQSLSWDLDRGSWAIVIMNADGSQGLAVEASAAARTDLLVPVAIGLLAVGAFLVIVALVLIIASMRRSDNGTTDGLPAAAGAFGPYPVSLEGDLDPGLSRWQWLFKWLLVLPHLIILAFLWAAFVLLTVVAWFAIVFTGRYPKAIFDFNVGVLRWSWRVGYYSYSALGTDNYPPFSLDKRDYPARFDVAYPEELSRGLALVKTWLLAIPHYLIVGLFTSGLIWWTTDIGERGNEVVEAGTGLIGILVLIAGVILLFSGRYPQGLFDLIMGLNRWVFRVIAYAALMRDEYPPFRLDTGGAEPGAGPAPSSPDQGDDDTVSHEAPAAQS